MRVGESIVVTEHIIVVGSFGSELLPRGTKGIITAVLENQAEIQTRYDRYTVPLASIKSVGDMAA